MHASVHTWHSHHSMQLVHFMSVHFSEWDHAHYFMFTYKQNPEFKNVHMNIMPLLLNFFLHKDHAMAT
jgi:hypothetical protein